MKLNKILSICTTMALLSSACSDDMGLQPDNAPVAGKGQTVRIAASMGNDGSRLAFNETETELVLSWEQTDVLKVLNPSRDTDITDFTLVDGEGTAVADFEGTPVNAYQEGDQLHALYYNSLVDTHIDEDGNVSISLKEQDGTLKQDFQLMYGSGIYEEGSPLSVKLANLVSIIKVTIPTDKTLTRISLTESIRSQGKLVVQNSPSDAPNLIFQPGDLVHNRDEYDFDENGQYIGNDGITLEGTFEPVDGEVTVYFYTLPVKEYKPDWDWYNDRGFTPSFEVCDTEGNVYYSTKEFNMKWMERGQMYEVSSDIFSIVEFANEAVADGSANNPYEIATTDQLYSLMLHCKLEHTDRNGNPYHNRHYLLTENIHLNGRLPWKSINWNNAVFDGNGYTIYGEVYGGLFGYVYNAVIRDLVLELTVINPESNSYSYAGSLAQEISSTTLYNCDSYSNLKINAENIGGLVGYMNNDSQMYGCSQNGSVVSTNGSWFNSAGGLVGRMGSNSIIEACYSMGSVIGETRGQNLYAGGLVGQMEMDAAGIYHSTLNSCWTSASLNISGTGSIMSGDFVGAGTCTSCFKSPGKDEIDAMNKAMANSLYIFDVNGNIITPKPSTSLPDIDIEDF